MNLKELKIGETVTVKSVDIDNKKRLFELGVVPNKVIKKEYESIDRKMIAIKVDGTIICLRDSLCKKIFVVEQGVSENEEHFVSWKSECWQNNII